MPEIGEMEAPVRKVLPIFYVLDTSGSMETDGKIATLNDAMRETTKAIAQIASSSADAELRIAVLEYSSGCRWVTDMGPEPLEEFEWEDLSASGMTDLGAALKELDKKLSHNEFLKATMGMFCPVVIFMTDGLPNDQWRGPLKDVWTNKWYRMAIKVGFALGADADVSTVASVVGDPEAVIRTLDLDVFKTLIQFVSVSASKLGSSTHTQGNAPVTGASIVQSIPGAQNTSVPSNTPYIEPADDNDPAVKARADEDDDDDGGIWGKEQV